jgi:hypothetical protein
LYGHWGFDALVAVDGTDIPKSQKPVRKAHVAHGFVYHGPAGHEKSCYQYNDEIEQVPKHIGHEKRLEPPYQFLDIQIDGEASRLEEKISRYEKEERIGDGGYALRYDVDDFAGHRKMSPLIADGPVVAVNEQNQYDEWESDECDYL